MDKGDICDVQMANAAIKNKLASYKSVFQNTLMLLSARQKELLYAVGKEGKAASITSGNFVKKHALLSSASVQNSVKNLLEKEILTSENGIYSVYDKFMGLWLKEELSNGYQLRIEKY
jgi:3-deoxy-D-manno-octulosonic acid (KDO) 8-phosphate synthase